MLKQCIELPEILWTDILSSREGLRIRHLRNGLGEMPIMLFRNLSLLGMIIVARLSFP